MQLTIVTSSGRSLRNEMHILSDKMADSALGLLWSCVTETPGKGAKSLVIGQSA